MKQTHFDIIPAAQSHVFAELSKRRMIGPLCCPLCDFTTERMAVSIDDRILSHLHEFALRALPENNGELGDDGSSSSDIQLSSSTAALSYTNEPWVEEVILDHTLSLSLANMQKTIKELESISSTNPSIHGQLYDVCKKLQLIIRRIENENRTGPAAELLAPAFQRLNGASRTFVEYASDEKVPLGGNVSEEMPITGSMVESIINDVTDHLFDAADDNLQHTDIEKPGQCMSYFLLLCRFAMAVTDSRTAKNSFYGALPAANREFNIAEREDILEELQSLLFVRANRLNMANIQARGSQNAAGFHADISVINDWSEQKNILLVGDRGAGKTEIALYLANQMKLEAEEWTILWVRARSKQSIQSSYLMILSDWELESPVSSGGDVENSIRAFLYRFTWTYSRPWLMILDGLEAPGAAYLMTESMLPRAGRGIFLITTRHLPLAKAFGPVDEIKVPTLARLLDEQIEKALVKGYIGEEFLPEDDLDSFVQEPIVAAALREHGGFPADEVPDLVQFVCNKDRERSARRLFLILVMIGKLPSLKILEADGVDDSTLPVGFLTTDDHYGEGFRLEDLDNSSSPEQSRYYPSFAWILVSRNERVLFSATQWKFLAPVFGSGRFRYRLNGRRRLPYLSVSPYPVSSGYFGEVSRAVALSAHFQSLPVSVYRTSFPAKRPPPVSGLFTLTRHQSTELWHYDFGPRQKGRQNNFGCHQKGERKRDRKNVQRRGRQPGEGPLLQE